MNSDLQTHLVNVYLNNLYESDYSKVNLNNYNNIISWLKRNNHFYYQYFSNIHNFANYIENILNKKIINEYTNNVDKDYLVNKNYFTLKKISFVYNYLLEDNFDKKIKMLNKINSCNLYPKFKKGNPMLPENYRYLSDHSQELKLIDRIISDIMLNIFPQNFINNDIFKAILSNNKKNIIDQCSNLADENTLNIENVVLLDINKAFDSVIWNILFDNMIEKLSNNIDKIGANAIVYEYFIILQNRNFYYQMNKKSKKYKINVKKGISQGLPSSNLIFTIFLNSIINKWINKLDINISEYFKLNIYIDDFYLKFKPQNGIDYRYFTDSLINELELNKLYVNKIKSLADEKLFLDFGILKNSDKYLGIPFTRDIKIYQEIIIKDYKEKHNKIIKIYNLDCTWFEFYNILNKNIIFENKKCIINHLIGFFKYKLKPLIIYYKYLEPNDVLTTEILIKFIDENLKSF